MPKVAPITQRKDDHIKINLEKDVRSALTTGLEKYHFVHGASPELDLGGDRHQPEPFRQEIGGSDPDKFHDRRDGGSRPDQPAPGRSRPGSRRGDGGSANVPRSNTRNKSRPLPSHAALRQISRCLPTWARCSLTTATAWTNAAVSWT